MKNSLIITLFFIAGMLYGKFLNILNTDNAGKFMEWSLYALMLFVGFSFGTDPKLKDIFRSFNFKLLVLPIITIIGTLLGISIYSLIFTELSVKDSFAVASGFGYYSLSSIIISEFSGSDIAVIALLSNVLREIITLVSTPLMARYLGPFSPICSAGATSMDTTLPVIVKSSGKKYLLTSLFHGILLTIIVPFLITFIYKVF
ncbi:MAG: lysine exporter LysO family protein [Bacteroidales bacterium]